MEKQVRIISQGALNQRNWTSPKGENVVISSVELVMTDGIDTFVAEVNDQKAIAINQEPLDQDAFYGVQIKMSVREWKNEQTQQMNHATNIRVINLTKIY